MKTKTRASKLVSIVANMITPKYIRCYDNGGKTADRYTVVFTGRYRVKTENQFIYIGMSEMPFHPLGIGFHGESSIQIDRPSYKHLGKKIKFTDLPKDCQLLVGRDYNYLWNIG